MRRAAASPHSGLSSPVGCVKCELLCGTGLCVNVTSEVRWRRHDWFSDSPAGCLSSADLRRSQFTSHLNHNKTQTGVQYSPARLVGLRRRGPPPLPTFMFPALPDQDHTQKHKQKPGVTRHGELRSPAASGGVTPWVQVQRALCAVPSSCQRGRVCEQRDCGLCAGCCAQTRDGEVRCAL